MTALRLSTLFTLVACAPSLEPDEDTGAGFTEEAVVTTDGGTTLTVDATSYEDWVALDLHSGTLGSIDNDGWEIAIRRYEVMLGTDVTAASVEGDFEDLEQPDASAFGPDLPDEDGDAIPEYVFADWYDYDEATHVLTPNAARAHAVLAADGTAFKVQCTSYYDDAGTPGIVAIRFAPLD